jgi:hypothetical protein
VTGSEGYSLARKNKKGSFKPLTGELPENKAFAQCSLTTEQIEYLWVKINRSLDGGLRKKVTANFFGGIFRGIKNAD